MTTQRSKLFDSVIISSWWVILFLLGLFFLYDQATTKRNREARRLHEKYDQLLIQREETTNHLYDLTLRKASQEDPQWIELVLREKLGLVSEKETKVLFR